MFWHAGFLVVKMHAAVLFLADLLCGKATLERHGLCELRSELKNIYNELKLIVNA